jgi:hypothetical protein
VVDRKDRGREVAELSRQLDAFDRVRFDRVDIDHLRLTDDLDKAFFVCTDDDIGNLAVALMLTKDVPGTNIFVRMSRWPMAAIADHFQERGGLRFVNINDLVREGLADLPGIFDEGERPAPKPIPGRPIRGEEN